MKSKTNIRNKIMFLTGEQRNLQNKYSSLNQIDLQSGEGITLFEEINRISGAINALYWVIDKAPHTPHKIKPMKDEIDYTLDKGDKVFFTWKTDPQKDDWHEAIIIDINWALKAAAISLHCFSEPIVCNIESLKREIK